MTLRHDILKGIWRHIASPPLVFSIEPELRLLRDATAPGNAGDRGDILLDAAGC
jgi:hypothetical protein